MESSAKTFSQFGLYWNGTEISLSQWLKPLKIVLRCTSFALISVPFGYIESFPCFEELTTAAEDAKASFTRLSNLQLRIAEAQPIIVSDMLELLTQAIDRITNRIPAWQRSLEEVQLELDAS
jgi:hypothetical protein